MPAPKVAVDYYTGGDLYLFGKLLIFMKSGCLMMRKLDFSHFSYLIMSDEFQTSRVPNSRRPKIGIF